VARVVFLLPPLYAMLLLGACGSGPPASAGGSGTVRNIEYAPDLVVVDESEAIRSLASMSGDGRVLVFEDAPAALRTITPGRTLLLRGLLAGRVLATETAGRRVALLITPAGLTDVITGGEIAFQRRLRFTPQGVRGANAGGRRRFTLVRPLYASDARDGSDLGLPAFGTVTKEVSGWLCTFTLTPGDDRLDIRVTLTKTVGSGVSVEITGEGWLEDFDVAGDILVERSSTERLRLAAQKVNGTMNLSWTVTQEVAGRHLDNQTIQLPGALSVPLAPLLGGLPLFLEVSAGVLVRPAVASRNQISQGQFRVTYDGAQGFTVRDGNIDPEGGITGEVDLVHAVNVAPLGGLGMVVALAAPRIDLVFGVGKALTGLGDFKLPAALADEVAERLARQAFGDAVAATVREHGISKALEDVTSTEAKAWLSLTSTAGVFKSSAASMLPCERHWLILTGSVGVTGNFLGAQAERQVVEVYRREKRTIDPPTPFCESAG
jgi:hypothetical protein